MKSIIFVLLILISNQPPHSRKSAWITDRLVRFLMDCCYAVCWHVSECEQQHNRMFDVIQPIFCALTHQFNEWCRHATVGQSTERDVAPQFFDRVPHYLLADVLLLSCLYLMESHLSKDFCRSTFANLNDKSVSFLRNSGFTPRTARMLAGESPLCLHQQVSKRILFDPT